MGPRYDSRIWGRWASQASATFLARLVRDELHVHRHSHWPIEHAQLQRASVSFLQLLPCGVVVRCRYEPLTHTTSYLAVLGLHQGQHAAFASASARGQLRAWHTQTYFQGLGEHTTTARPRSRTRALHAFWQRTQHLS